MKLNLYIDFDGVILNTIEISYKDFKEINKQSQGKISIKEYYENLNWEELLNKSTPINNSIENIKKLVQSNLYNIYILSNVFSEKEAKVKQNYITEKLPNIKLITVLPEQKKCDIVDCKNSILVDDYMGNLEIWFEKGGIPVKFSDKGKKRKFLTVTSLDMLLDKYDEIKEIIDMSQK